MISYVRAYLHRRRQRQAEAAALRNSEHAWAIRVEAARAYGNECALINAERNAPSLPSQQLATEIEELRAGKVSSIARRRAAKDHRGFVTSFAPKNGHKA